MLIYSPEARSKVTPGERDSGGTPGNPLLLFAEKFFIFYISLGRRLQSSYILPNMFTSLKNYKATLPLAQRNVIDLFPLFGSFVCLGGGPNPSGLKSNRVPTML